MMVESGKKFLPVLYNWVFANKVLFDMSPLFIEKSEKVDEIIQFADDVESIYSGQYFSIGSRTLKNGKTDSFELVMSVDVVNDDEEKNMAMTNLTKIKANQLIKGLLVAVKDKYPITYDQKFTEMFKEDYTKFPIHCQECGDRIGYFHRAKEPEDMVRGGRLNDKSTIPEILFCKSCEDRYGKEWEEDPYIGDFDDDN